MNCSALYSGFQYEFLDLPIIKEKTLDLRLINFLLFVTEPPLSYLYLRESNICNTSFQLF